MHLFPWRLPASTCKYADNQRQSLSCLQNFIYSVRRPVPSSKKLKYRHLLARLEAGIDNARYNVVYDSTHVEDTERKLLVCFFVPIV